MATDFNRRIPRVLFFVRGMTPTDAQREEAKEYGPRCAFRNALLVNNDPSTSGLDECDFVAGEVPERYAAAYPNVSEASGEGSWQDRASDYDRVHGDVRDPNNERARGARPPSVNERAEQGVGGTMNPVRANQGWTLPDGGLVGGTEGRQAAPANSPAPNSPVVGLAPNDPFAAVPGSPSWPSSADFTDPSKRGDALARTTTVTGDTNIPNVGDSVLKPKTEGETEASGFDKMSRAELDAEAEKRGLDPADYSNKAAVVEAIKAHDANGTSGEFK